MTDEDKDCLSRVVGIVTGLMIAGLFVVACLSSCNVTRTVTTTAQTIQRGDTTTTITTRTVEQYDAKADVMKLFQPR